MKLMCTSGKPVTQNWFTRSIWAPISRPSSAKILAVCSKSGYNYTRLLPTISALSDLLDAPGPEFPLPGETEAVLDRGDGARGGAGVADPLVPHPGPALSLSLTLAVVCPGLNALSVVQRGRGLGVNWELAPRQDSDHWTVTPVSSQLALSSSGLQQ